jgi:murein DD-endopeptidase MepM/ murein hydrolase activator NlpD
MMKRFQRIENETGVSGLPAARAVAVSAVLLLGGCSADVGRFDFPAFNLNAKGDATGSLPVPPEPVGGGIASAPIDSGSTRDSYSGGTYVPPRTSRPERGGVEMAALPDASRSDAPSYRAPSQPYASAPRHDGDRAASRTPRGAAAPDSEPAGQPGETIEVRSGDTVFGLARRHGVTVNALMAANNMTNSQLRVGQRLQLPNGGARSAATVAASEPSRRSQAPSVAVNANPPANWSGSYTVKSGDSLYRIARQHNIKVAELQSANGITNPMQLKPGLTLHVPGDGGVAAGASKPASVAAAEAASPSMPETTAPRAIQSTTQPTLLNGSRQVAALDEGRVTDAPASAPAATQKPTQTAAAATAVPASMSKLRWPAKGKVLSGFGQRSDGTHNDGVNIAVPQGTEVHAAEEGEVAYAGSELKGYGNLVLIRHDNGWVTAYAHNDTLLVKRGDKVRRGDVVAKAGSSGQVDQPQVHFELRQGSKPIDPLPYLERL